MTFIIYLIIFGGIYLGAALLLPKAGKSTVASYLPIYNLYTWTQAIHKPWWWVILLIFPGVNILMLMIMCVNLGTVFGKRTAMDVLSNSFLPFITLPMLGLNKETRYVGPIDRKKFQKTQSQEWRDAILFAVVAASLIRTYFMEAFTIPTSSMEKSMLVGDFLFVSKAAYGPKAPQTPLAVPFFHHTIPVLNVTSYLEWIHLPFFRLPGFGEVERNDVVVFNFPAGDTVVVDEQALGFDQIVRNTAWQRFRSMDIRAGREEKSFDEYAKQGREMVLRTREITVRPVDKREHYIKRCVAVAGDKLEIKAGILYVNEEEAYLPPEMQYNYFVGTEDFLNRNVLKNDLGIYFSDQQRVPGQPGYIMPLTFEMYDRINEFPSVIDVRPSIDASGKNSPIYPIFPNHPSYEWTEDNFGPLVIPKKGTTVNLNLNNLPLYKRLIQVYEGHDLGTHGESIFIDGVEQTSYTFEMDYYFMMGDNRHNSADSRFWGFVPEDHIVGEGSFIWLSLDKERSWLNGKIRWDRFFKGIE